MPLINSCFCGAHKIALPEQVSVPNMLAICHCLSCQHRSGSAFHAGAVFMGGSPSWLHIPTSSSITAETSGPTDKIGLNSWSSDAGNMVDRAFCRACGGTLGMWFREIPGEEKTVTWLTIPAPNLTNFDWRKMAQQEKDKVAHCWTKCAVFGVPEGYVAFAEQPGPAKEMLQKI